MYGGGYGQQRRPQTGRGGQRPPFPQRGGPMQQGRGIPRRAGGFTPRGGPVHMGRGPAPMGRFPMANTNFPQQQPRYGTVGDSYFPFLQLERKLPELCKRYPKLYYSQDLTQALAHWTQQQAKLQDAIPLSTHIDFCLDSENTVVAPEAKKDGDDAEMSAEDTYSVQVMLLNPDKPIVEEEAAEGEEKKTPKPTPHQMQQIKFVMGANQNGTVVPYGGNWDAKDGDPKKDATLVKTAIRSCKESCGLDLSGCKTWTKFLEVQYRRKSGGMHYSVVLLPNVWEVLAGKEKIEVCKSVVKEEKEVEEEEEVTDEEAAPAEPKEGEEAAEPAEKKKKIIKKKVTKEVDKVVVRPIEMTLQSLVDLHTNEAGEATVEACLFAQNFDEFISYGKTKKILTFLRQKKKESDEQAAIVKAKREEEQAERQAEAEKKREASEAKRRKLGDEQEEKEAEKKKREEEEKTMTEDEKTARKEEEAAKAAAEKKEREEQAKAEREEAQKKREEELKARQEEEAAKRKAQDEEDKARGYRIAKQTITHVDKAQAEPFEYFDRPSGTSGQIRREVMEGILHALGELTQREVDSLLRAVGLSMDRAHSPLFYRRLASYNSIEEKHLPLLPEKKEEKEGEAMEEDKPEEAAPAEAEAPATEAPAAEAPAAEEAAAE
eukprot:NODE_245_length_2126_cov_91.904189_g164_i0.p1 GENE.NODE_245_length_2126_cov_91.904189_g164_i0~~NODE_245_length_2126_cov_91.904189_g164_i0.p1  ORF type:complete len:677 (+),score=241.54 NODE_245_length_2126_cov_91.904189_g164_i0:52-2031(+)